MTKLKIEPGVCGLTAIVTAESEDGMDVTVSIETPCSGCTKLVESLDEELGAYDVVFQKPGSGPIYEAARVHCIHGACPVPAGIVKCIEAECKMALKKEVRFEFL